VVIGLSFPRFQQLKTLNLPTPQGVSVRGLIDTGASNTMVDPSVIQTLGVPVRGDAQVKTPSTGNNPVTVSTYEIGFFIPHTTSPQVFKPRFGC
jgi:hypothetical protein